MFPIMPQCCRDSVNDLAQWCHTKWSMKLQIRNISRIKTWLQATQNKLVTRYVGQNLFMAIVLRLLDNSSAWLADYQSGIYLQATLSMDNQGPYIHTLHIIYIHTHYIYIYIYIYIQRCVGLQSCPWHPWTALWSWPWWRVCESDWLITSVDRLSSIQATSRQANSSIWYLAIKKNKKKICKIRTMRQNHLRTINTSAMNGHWKPLAIVHNIRKAVHCTACV